MLLWSTVTYSTTNSQHRQCHVNLRLLKHNHECNLLKMANAIFLASFVWNFGQLSFYEFSHTNNSFVFQQKSWNKICDFLTKFKNVFGLLARNCFAFARTRYKTHGPSPRWSNTNRLPQVINAFWVFKNVLLKIQSTFCQPFSSLRNRAFKLLLVYIPLTLLHELSIAVID